MIRFPTGLEILSGIFLILMVYSRFAIASKCPESPIISSCPSSIRTVSINPQASRLMGINSNMVITTVFAIAGALAGVSGVLLGAKYSVYPSLGQSMMIKGFIASVIGGLGSMGGAISAAIILGLVEIFLTYWVGSLSTPIILFGAMLLFLVIRPNGLAGRFAKEKV